MQKNSFIDLLYFSQNSRRARNLIPAQLTKATLYITAQNYILLIHTYFVTVELLKIS